MFANEAPWLAWPEDRIVTLTGYSAFSAAFLSNPHVKEFVARLFDNECPLRDILPYLIVPASAVRTVLEPLQARVRAHETIALQIRVGSDTNYFTAGPWRDKVSADVAQRYEQAGTAAAGLWFDCALAALKDDAATLIYLATDNPAVRQQARALFGQNLVESSGPIEHSGYIENTKTLDGQIKVLVDWWLIGEASVLYRTWWYDF